ncbi:MAG: hypothetical protein ACI8Y3_000504 [Paraglaciecola sp.]|jgi:hypothetical protein
MLAISASCIISFSAYSETQIAPAPSQADIAEGFTQAINLQDVDTIANFIDFKA